MTLPLRSGRWVLDPVHCTVEFTARHMGISKVRGRFTRFDASVDIGETLLDTRLRAEVDLSSVDTGNAQRDDHLRGSDFFDVERRPTMIFTSTTIRTTDEHRYVLDGELTVNGITRAQSFDMVFDGVQTFPGDGSTHAGFEAYGSLRRSDFAIDFNVPLGAGGFVISDRIGIELDAQLLPAVELTAAGER